MSTAEPAITLLIVDDHAFVRQAFVTLLSLDNRLQVLGDCGELDEAHSENLRLCPQVILLDFQLAEGHCLQAIQRLRQTPHQPRVLVLSSFAAGVNVFAAMQAGAAGYLLKSNPASLVVAGILRVASGRSAFAPELGDLRIQPSSPIALTASELRILELLAQGHSNDVIAGQLGIMVSTVKTHVHHILDKLGARSRTEALARARSAGWLGRSEGS